MHSFSGESQKESQHTKIDLEENEGRNTRGASDYYQLCSSWLLSLLLKILGHLGRLHLHHLLLLLLWGHPLRLRLSRQLNHLSLYSSWVLLHPSHLP